MFWKVFAVAALLVAAVHVGATHQNNVSETKIISFGSNSHWVEVLGGEYRDCRRGLGPNKERGVVCWPWYPAFER